MILRVQDNGVKLYFEGKSKKVVVQTNPSENWKSWSTMDGRFNEACNIKIVDLLMWNKDPIIVNKIELRLTFLADAVANIPIIRR